MHKKILVTGSNGQVGTALRTIAASEKTAPLEFVFTDRGELDITDIDAIEKAVKEYDVDTIVNCAAYTAVDKAEEEEANAKRINADAVGYLARICKTYDVGLIHLSTDYVFGGHATQPWREEDPVRPEGVYARTKYEGEVRLREYNPPRSMIIRTSWVYGESGHNFVKTMLRLGREREVLRVVDDQIGSPTYTMDLAAAIVNILLQNPQNDETELYHYSNEGICSWYEFAKKIFELADIPCKVEPIPTSAYPTPAKRPLYSVLCKEKIARRFGLEIPHWEVSLRECIANLTKDCD